MTLVDLYRKAEELGMWVEQHGPHWDLWVGGRMVCLAQLTDDQYEVLGKIQRETFGYEEEA